MRLIITFLFLALLLPIQSMEYGLYIKEGGEGWSVASAGMVAGTLGQSRKVDAFRISGVPFAVRFSIHAKEIGWTDWKDQGDFWSSNGRRLEALRFSFPAGIPNGSAIIARVHLQNIGWTEPVVLRDGTILGTTGEHRRLEAIQMMLVQGIPADRYENISSVIHVCYTVAAGLQESKISEDQAYASLTSSQCGLSPSTARGILDNFRANMNLIACATGCPAACVAAVADKVFAVNDMIQATRQQEHPFDNSEYKSRERNLREAIRKEKISSGEWSRLHPDRQNEMLDAMGRD